jgi:hypothetical protein
MRFFSIFCNSGLLAVVAGLERLEELGLVVEYGTAYMGHQSFLDALLSRLYMIYVTKSARPSRAGALDSLCL